MTDEPRLRADICRIARSLFDRGLTCGSSGNLSARLPDGTLLVTPTGSSLGFLDPDRLSHLDAQGNLLAGDAPTKEVALHLAFYATRPATGAVVHLHSTHAVAWSMMPDIDPDDALPLITPYALMQLGRVRLLPFMVPGDPAMGRAIMDLAGAHKAVLLANHGPVVSDTTIWSAAFAMEELEETAKLALLPHGIAITRLNAAARHAILARFG